MHPLMPHRRSILHATSDTISYGNIVCDSIPEDEEYDTYLTRDIFQRD